MRKGPKKMEDTEGRDFRPGNMVQNGVSPNLAIFYAIGEHYLVVPEP